MPGDIDIRGKAPEEIGLVVAKAAPGTVFLAAPSQITTLQFRVDGLKQSLVLDYSMTPERLPPGTGYFCPQTKRIYRSDGDHREAARILAGEREGLNREDIPIPLYLTIGSQSAAKLDAAGANAEHGLRRTDRDKRNAIRVLLLDPELGHYTNRRLARAARVAPETIEREREAIEREGLAPKIPPDQRIGERNGKLYRSKPKTIKPKPAVFGTATSGGGGGSANLNIVAPGSAGSSIGTGPRAPVNPKPAGTAVSCATVDDGCDISTSNSASVNAEAVPSALASEIARKVASVVQVALAGFLPIMQANAKMELAPQAPSESSTDGPAT